MNPKTNAVHHLPLISFIPHSFTSPSHRHRLCIVQTSGLRHPTKPHQIRHLHLLREPAGRRHARSNAAENPPTLMTMLALSGSECKSVSPKKKEAELCFLRVQRRGPTMARLSRPFLGIKPQPGFSFSLADNPKSTSSAAIPRLPLAHYPCQARGRLAVARCGSASLSVGQSGDFSSPISVPLFFGCCGCSNASDWSRKMPPISW